jgi:biopolymer transport protein ExbB/TolQ
VTKEAKNPVYGWVAVGLAVAVTAVVAYSILKPEEDELWQDVREESTEG